MTRLFALGSSARSLRERRSTTDRWRDQLVSRQGQGREPVSRGPARSVAAMRRDCATIPVQIPIRATAKAPLPTSAVGPARVGVGSIAVSLLTAAAEKKRGQGENLGTEPG